MTTRLVTCLMLALLMCLGLAAATTVYAAEGDGDDVYSYRVSIYSGKQGEFSTGKVWEKDLKAGESISISTEDLGLVLEDDRYYVRGFRVAGHDNDETTGIQRLQIDNIDTDVAYVLAYGIKGAMVQYTVNYVDKDGNELRESDTYYGMPGDKPVVSYRYIDGYTPNAYNQAKTLVENEVENVFTFTYKKIENPPATTRPTQAPGNGTPGNGTPGNGAPGNGNNNAGPNAANAAANNGARAPGTTGNPAGTAVPNGNDLTNIDDNGTPLADEPQQYVDLDDQKTPLASGRFGGSHSLPILIGSIVVLLAGIFLIIIALRRRKNRQTQTPAGA